MAYTFELGGRFLVHPDTRREDLDSTLLRILSNVMPDIEEFLTAQNIPPSLEGKVMEWDSAGDPLCAMILTIEDEAQAVYFKMWWASHPKNNAV